MSGFDSLDQGAQKYSLICCTCEPAKSGYNGESENTLADLGRIEIEVWMKNEVPEGATCPLTHL